jgi:Fe-S oxidoreductase
VQIHIVDKIATLRRGRVAEGCLPETAAEALETSSQKDNPFGQAASARMEWASGLEVSIARPGEPVDLLYWVGCAGAFDPAGREVARAMVRLLNHLKISYRVLGCEERCSGDPARRLGEEGLWQDLAAANRKSFANHSVKTILTSCAHCFNTFRSEYPSTGPMPEVLHHSQWLRARIEEGSLILKETAGETIVFHDPCYLSRAGNEVEAPRAILDRVAIRVEMKAHGRNSFCCGGGGGQMWLDVRGQTRVESLRASQVQTTGAGTVATGCPFCRVMLEAGRASLPEGQGRWQVKDLAEIVVERLV